ncbi:hypothetical protein ACIBCC_29985 [Streptomyces griseus]|uniref:hypothetical protein n=1 Tax=Streptomyces griseus TaxID=1911 RepID=UPI0037BBFF18
MDNQVPAVLAQLLTPAEQEQVEWAAAVAGRPVDDFVRDAVLAAAADPLLAALDQAADRVAGVRDFSETAGHGYAAA